MRDDQDLHTAFLGAEDTAAQTGAPQASDYMDALSGDDYADMSDAEKLELLECLIVIMQSFVNLGHGLDPVNKLIEQFEFSSLGDAPMIDLEDAKDDE